MTIWKLKQGADRRVRQGHPWVFSNELEKSPKGHPPGEPVELQDSKGQFLARGYGNPHSLISFRALSFVASEKMPTSYEALCEKLKQSWMLRKKLGFLGSFRLCFGEVDGIPGLVVDYYLCEQNSKKFQVFSIQVLSAGMEYALKDIPAFFQMLIAQIQTVDKEILSWDQSILVLRNDVQIRTLEGLPVIESLILKNIDDIDLKQAEILLNEAYGESTLKMNCNLFDGQKTGFFLDQTHNIFLLNQMLKSLSKTDPAQKKIKVLDICCYVGHWSTQITNTLKKFGYSVEVTQVDISKEALSYARINAERAGAKVISLAADVSKDLDQIASNHYDLVIADPPAFIKSKKDIPVGQHAYMKLNTQAFRVVKKGGLVVSCSCSGLLNEEDFRYSIQKAISRNANVQTRVQGVLRGGHAADHPTLIQFPEGFYLKMFVHHVGE